MSFRNQGLSNFRGSFLSKFCENIVVMQWIYLKSSLYVHLCVKDNRILTFFTLTLLTRKKKICWSSFTLT